MFKRRNDCESNKPLIYYDRPNGGLSFDVWPFPMLFCYHLNAPIMSLFPVFFFQNPFLEYILKLNTQNDFVCFLPSIQSDRLKCVEKESAQEGTFAISLCFFLLYVTAWK